MEGKENWWVILHPGSQINLPKMEKKKEGENGFEVKKDITTHITPLFKTIIRV